MKGSNPSFYYQNSVVEANRMGKLFWADSMSKFDYQCFGDVIVFDSTFKRN